MRADFCNTARSIGIPMANIIAPGGRKNASGNSEAQKIRTSANINVNEHINVEKMTMNRHVAGFGMMLTVEEVWWIFHAGGLVKSIWSVRVL